MSDKTKTTLIAIAYLLVTMGGPLLLKLFVFTSMSWWWLGLPFYLCALAGLALILWLGNTSTNQFN